MALKFNPTSTASSTSETDEFDIAKERGHMSLQLANSEELDKIVSTISVNDLNTIVSFGKESAEDISRCSDQILSSMNMAQVNDSGELLHTLGKIMDKFDMNELSDSGNKGFFGKIFHNINKQLEQILAKYHTMGEDIDKVFVKLKEYENEIVQSNQKLEAIFESNIGYYRELVKYILAGEQGIKEIDEYLVQLGNEHETTKDKMVLLDIQNLEQARELLDQRVMDLKIAENVAMQSIPMVKSMQYGNLNLTRKINSAFIITLPVFKQALTQAILLKRQKIQMQAMQALDERTNEMLLKNAQNTAEQSALAARLASGSSVKIETLEKTWQTIVKGIEETKQIQLDAQKKREEDTLRLNKLKEDFLQVGRG